MTNPDGYQNPDSIGAGGDPSGWGSVAALFGGFYDTTVNSQTARRNTDKTIEAQKAEAEKAYQRQVEMWHLQNAYNSPAEQMKRFGAAGLNPHLIYGKGNEGNASKFPEYQAPNLQYRYEAPQYGAATSTAIQQLMQVGTWMQNMKLSEQQLQGGETRNLTAAEALAFMRDANPKKLSELDNRLSMFPYQSAMSRNLAETGNIKITDMLEELRYKWGVDYNDLEFGAYETKGAKYGSQRSEEALKRLAERKLLEAKASWTDFNITDPQSLIQMVLRGVMGMAGQTMRVNPKGRVSPTIGKGQPGRWSMPAKRWIPTKNWRGQWKSETP